MQRYVVRIGMAYGDFRWTLNLAALASTLVSLSNARQDPTPRFRFRASLKPGLLSP